MKAILTNYRQSPRKVRLVADAIKGKRVAAAEIELQFLVKRASLPFMKLLASAVANAKQNFNIDREDLYVKDVRVDKGVVLKRMMPRARGSASRINKRTSHVVLILAEKGKEEKPARNATQRVAGGATKTLTKPPVKKVVKKVAAKKEVSK